MNAQGNSQPLIVECIDSLISGLWSHQLSNSKVAQAVQELQWLKADLVAGLAPLSHDWEMWFFRTAHDINVKRPGTNKAVAIADELAPLLLTPKRLSTSIRKYHLRLFVAGNSAPSLRALDNLRLICCKLGAICKWDVIDILENPAAGAQEGIIATPTLVRLAPLPKRKLIGDLTDANSGLLILGSRHLISAAHDSHNTSFIPE